MALYYLDESDEPRECPYCKGDGECRPITLGVGCGFCHGSGRLGDPDGPRVEVNDASDGSWWWRWIGAEEWNHGGPHPTSEAALQAAREAHRVECRWCGTTNECDCEDRADCPKAGEAGHKQCGRRPDGTPRFVPAE